MNARAFKTALAALRRTVAQFPTQENLDGLQALRALDANSIDRLEPDSIRAVTRALRRLRAAMLQRARAMHACRAAQCSLRWTLGIAKETARAAAVPPPPKPPRKRRQVPAQPTNETPQQLLSNLLFGRDANDGTPSDGAP